MNEQESSSVPALFQSPAALADAAAVARATQEIQASLVIAQRFPRDEVKAKTKILEACKRRGLAEVAEYEYSRGGTKIVGPTIDLLRAIASRWGNLLFGWMEAERRNGESSIRCWAWDTQSNSRAERTFIQKHWRDTKDGGYELKDERDIYELLANNAARRVRACLEEIIDSDIIEDAVDACRKTLREGEKTPLTDRVVAMVGAFREMGVTQAQIEQRLGNKADAISENQLASLRRVYKSIKDGVGKTEDFFKSTLEPVAPKMEGYPTGPAPAAEEQHKPAEKGGSYNYVKALQGLCKVAKVEEGEVIGFLVGMGLIEESLTTFADIEKANPTALKTAHDSWKDIAERVKAARPKEGTML